MAAGTANGKARSSSSSSSIIKGKLLSLFDWSRGCRSPSGGVVSASPSLDAPPDAAVSPSHSPLQSTPGSPACSRSAPAESGARAAGGGSDTSGVRTSHGGGSAEDADAGAPGAGCLMHVASRGREWGGEAAVPPDALLAGVVEADRQARPGAEGRVVFAEADANDEGSDTPGRGSMDVDGRRGRALQFRSSLEWKTAPASSCGGGREERGRVGFARERAESCPASTITDSGAAPLRRLHRRPEHALFVSGTCSSYLSLLHTSRVMPGFRVTWVPLTLARRCRDWCRSTDVCRACRFRSCGCQHRRRVKRERPRNAPAAIVCRQARQAILPCDDV